MWGSRSVFLSSLEVQLYISAEMAFLQAKNRVKQYLSQKKLDSSFLDSEYFSIDERTRIISLWMQLGGGGSSEAQNYETFVSKQENARTKALFQVIKKSDESKATS